MPSTLIWVDIGYGGSVYHSHPGVVTGTQSPLRTFLRTPPTVTAHTTVATRTGTETPAKAQTRTNTKVQGRRRPSHSQHTSTRGGKWNGQNTRNKEQRPSQSDNLFGWEAEALSITCTRLAVTCVGNFYSHVQIAKADKNATDAYVWMMAELKRLAESVAFDAHTPPVGVRHIHDAHTKLALNLLRSVHFIVMATKRVHRPLSQEAVALVLRYAYQTERTQGLGKGPVTGLGARGSDSVGGAGTAVSGGASMDRATDTHTGVDGEVGVSGLPIHAANGATDTTRVHGGRDMRGKPAMVGLKTCTIFNTKQQLIPALLLTESEMSDMATGDTTDSNRPPVSYALAATHPARSGVRQIRTGRNKDKLIPGGERGVYGGGADGLSLAHTHSHTHTRARTHARPSSTWEGVRHNALTLLQAMARHSPASEKYLLWGKLGLLSNASGAAQPGKGTSLIWLLRHVDLPETRADVAMTLCAFVEGTQSYLSMAETPPGCTAPRGYEYVGRDNVGMDNVGDHRSVDGVHEKDSESTRQGFKQPRPQTQSHTHTREHVPPQTHTPPSQTHTHPKTHMRKATAKSSLAFTSRSQLLGHSLICLHTELVSALHKASAEHDTGTQIALLKCLSSCVLGTPYARLPLHLLYMVVRAVYAMLPEVAEAFIPARAQGHEGLAYKLQTDNTHPHGPPHAHPPRPNASATLTHTRTAEQAHACELLVAIIVCLGAVCRADLPGDQRLRLLRSCGGSVRVEAHDSTVDNTHEQSINTHGQSINRTNGRFSGYGAARHVESDHVLGECLTRLATNQIVAWEVRKEALQTLCYLARGHLELFEPWWSIGQGLEWLVNTTLSSHAHTGRYIPTPAEAYALPQPESQPQSPTHTRNRTGETPRGWAVEANANEVTAACSATGCDGGASATVDTATAADAGVASVGRPSGAEREAQKIEREKDVGAKLATGYVLVEYLKSLDAKIGDWDAGDGVEMEGHEHESERCIGEAVAMGNTGKGGDQSVSGVLNEQDKEQNGVERTTRQRHAGSVGEGANTRTNTEGDNTGVSSDEDCQYDAALMQNRSLNNPPPLPSPDQSSLTLTLTPVKGPAAASERLLSLAKAVLYLYVPNLISEDEPSLRVLASDMCACMNRCTVSQLKPLQVMQLKVALLGLSQDTATQVKSSAFRALGMLVCLQRIRRDGLFLNDLAEVGRRAFEVRVLTVRLKASWALASLCDALVRDLLEGKEDRLSGPEVQVVDEGMGQGIQGDMWDTLHAKLLAIALSASDDNDKVLINRIRMLGCLVRLTGTPTVPTDQHTVQRAIDCITQTIGKGSAKLRWNACYAMSHVFSTPHVTPRAYQEGVRALCVAVKESKNFKIRINAAQALCVLDRADRLKVSPVGDGCNADHIHTAQAHHTPVGCKSAGRGCNGTSAVCVDTDSANKQNGRTSGDEGELSVSGVCTKFPGDSGCQATPARPVYLLYDVFEAVSTSLRNLDRVDEVAEYRYRSSLEEQLYRCIIQIVGLFTVQDIDHTREAYTRLMRWTVQQKRNRLSQMYSTCAEGVRLRVRVPTIAPPTLERPIAAESTLATPASTRSDESPSALAGASIYPPVAMATVSTPPDSEFGWLNDTVALLFVRSAHMRDRVCTNEPCGDVWKEVWEAYDDVVLFEAQRFRNA
ncbi:hypothetical protein SARC_05031 [Sphaeroforma arctica JP610]|uniref:DUF4042 domain-containing protein n=1 Tax=Sphaeroforma arctica JP610 TaxID=667725 RepID=A0A0L0G0Q7_9EUKA|nr:hypothetical protein SARC_05031 [Sphaeroforma arctica JP610]KNC82692.1 hypothetical protein SARC_05031 [Sphaeroforma arctica JP610]|eukprot:XP_014156594.1 hypothetical protein SARC_05031 [Sphaeroforma arctica JP610]